MLANLLMIASAASMSASTHTKFVGLESFTGIDPPCKIVMFASPKNIA